MQLTPEEIETAERYRYRHYERDSDGDITGNGLEHLKLDRHTLADLALRLLAADDETPVDEAWLRSVGFIDDYDDMVIGDDIYEGMSLVANSRDREWHIGNIRGNHTSLVRLSEVPKTRGEVRRLCRALGISLQETPTP